MSVGRSPTGRGGLRWTEAHGLSPAPGPANTAHLPGRGWGGGLGQGSCWPLPIHTRHPGFPFGAQAGAAQDVRPQPGELCPALPGKRTPGPPPFTPSTKSGDFSRDPLKEDFDPEFPRLIPRPAPTSCPVLSRLSEKPGLLSLSSARVPPPGRPGGRSRGAKVQLSRESGLPAHDSLLQSPGPGPPRSLRAGG